MSEADLAVVARIARLLNAGDSPDATLAAVASVLHGALGAERVTIWRRAGGGEGFVAAAAPEGAAEPDAVAALELVPASGARVVLRPADSAAPFGLLEVDDARRDDRVFLGLVADLLSPYLGSLRLSEDRASDAAEQARAMDEARRFTELIIDSLPVGLYAVDRNYRIQVWNRKRETGTQGLRRGAVVGRTVFEVLTRQPSAQLRAEFDRVFETGEVVQSELDVETPDGRRTYRLTRIPMRLGGDAITHVITIGEDVSEWRDVQAHIIQSEKLAALGQLAAGIMHEINNPLATIAACVAAGEGRLSEVQGPGHSALREYLSIIDREVVRCTNIVDGLLDFSRPKGKAKAETDVNRVVEEALGLLRHHKRFKAMTVTRDLAEGLPRVVVNAEQIIQVLMALTINALDAMESGGRLTVRTARSRRNADEIVIEVEDTGPGVASELRSKIFEPFFTTKPQGRGTGLGLSICYGIVEEHRGRIEVDGNPARGATFRVYLPAAPAHAERT